ncbi:glycosyltransferase family 39 protein [Streptomyces sp. LaPpAH-108]|uniref:glycosyltransferase family 39 protein n=1 Tax=Streptomyces sp. LaPpAH-108 TaxID=1155714 RepID=UPI00039B7630|nr:glycosyltransferase family 39 protein [Streptomyces sp. LaPpAH-108]
MVNVGPLVEPQPLDAAGEAAVVPVRAADRATVRAPGRGALAAVVPAAVMLALGLWGVDRGGTWRDEAVTLQVARRGVPDIWRLLHSVDAVHGLYYLLMHAVLAVRPDEVLLRLPSVCAATVTAALVGTLGTRLAGPRVGLWAGLLYAITPMAGHYAQEGRSYALVAAGATGATLLLTRAVRTNSWRSYGLLLGLTCWLHEFAVLLLLAHAVSLALARADRRVWRGWGRAAGAVVLALLPMALVSHAQSAQLAWLGPPTWDTAQGLLRAFLGESDPLYWTCLPLALLGLAGLAAPRGRLTLARLCLPLTVVPPAALMLASQLSPLYVDRYVLYALSGAPLLVAAGADAVVRRCLPTTGGRWFPSLAAAFGVALLGLAYLGQLPLLRADRDPANRPDDLGAVARVAEHAVRPGQPVLFLPAQARNAALAYPDAFRGVRDVALLSPVAPSGTLYGREADPALLRARLARLDRVWVVADRDLMEGRWSPAGAAERAKMALLAEEFTPVEETLSPDASVRLYVRRAGVSGVPGTPPGPVPPRPAPR